MASALLLLVLPVLSQGRLFYTKTDLPDNAWTMEDDGSGFMPAADPEALAYMKNFHSQKMQEQQQREMESSSASSSSSSNSNYFVDGSETYWADGSQAWRLLGFYIDCYSFSSGYNEAHRSLKDENNQYQNIMNGACVRYLLWAAVRSRTSVDGRIGFLDLTLL